MPISGAASLHFYGVGHLERSVLYAYLDLFGQSEHFLHHLLYYKEHVDRFCKE